MTSLVNKTVFKRGLLSGSIWNGLGRPSTNKWQYNFDGIDDYGTIPPITLGGDFEISLYATNDFESNDMTLGLTGYVNTWGFYRSISSNFTFCRFAVDDIVYINLGSSFVAAVDEEVFYKVRRVGLVAEFLINDNVVDTQALGSLNPIQIDIVGNRGSGSNYWGGNIRDVYFKDLSNPSNSRYYPLDDSWGNNPILRQSLPHSHKIDGTESFDSSTQTWIDYEKPEYHFDGIDDYIQLPNIPLFIGDVVEFKAFMVSDLVSVLRFFFDGELPRTYCYIGSADQVEVSSNIATIEVDGIEYANSDSLVSISDDKFHNFKVTMSGAAVISTIGSRYTANANFFDNMISDFRIVRADRDSLEQYPDLFWPIDDGFDNNPTVSQVLSTSTNWDGTAVNFNAENWENPALQYEGVTGYETLAERAALSGLSEHEEAVASCREGLVKNGDFRFGDNGQWANGVITNQKLVLGDSALAKQDGIDIDASLDYVLEFTISDSTGSGVRAFIYGDVNQGYVTSYFTDGTYRVVVTDFSSDLGVTQNRISFQAAVGGSGSVSEVTFRKVTDQQVLTSYVNHGEAINFNEENWDYE